MKRGFLFSVLLLAASSASAESQCVSQGYSLTETVTGKGTNDDKAKAEQLSQADYKENADEWQEKRSDECKDAGGQVTALTCEVAPGAGDNGASGTSTTSKLTNREKCIDLIIVGISYGKRCLPTFQSETKGQCLISCSKKACWEKLEYSNTQASHNNGSHDPVSDNDSTLDSDVIDSLNKLEQFLN